MPALLRVCVSFAKPVRRSSRSSTTVSRAGDMTNTIADSPRDRVSGLGREGQSFPTHERSCDVSRRKSTGNERDGGFGEQQDRNQTVTSTRRCSSIPVSVDAAHSPDPGLLPRMRYFFILLYSVG